MLATTHEIQVFMFFRAVDSLLSGLCIRTLIHYMAQNPKEDRQLNYYEHGKQIALFSW
jgi:hypothetical protein